MPVAALYLTCPPSAPLSFTSSSTDALTPLGSPHEESASSLPPLTRFTSLPEHHHVSLPKTKSTSNLLSQRSPAALSVNTKRMSIDAGQLDRMAR